MTKYTGAGDTVTGVKGVRGTVTGLHYMVTGVRTYMTQCDTATYSIQNLFNSLKLFSHGEGQSHLGS